MADALAATSLLSPPPLLLREVKRRLSQEAQAPAPKLAHLLLCWLLRVAAPLALGVGLDLAPSEMGYRPPSTELRRRP